jgi:xanthine dehydrogenase accessory factor
MSPVDVPSSDLDDAAQALRDQGRPFAYATIVRTAGTTAAKPGAKAIIDEEGAILHGFLGGGCTRGAVKRAGLAAIAAGAPQLISVTPEDDLNERGLTPGAKADGVTYARNGCPSRGTIDIFIEPCLPMPELVVLGTSPVSRALADLAPRFHWAVAESLDPARLSNARLRAILVATQGQDDLKALTAALNAQSHYVAFVGSRKKFSALSDKLADAGVARALIDAVSAPAGLNIGAVTPEEIALSILAELTQVRRRTVARGAETDA